LKEGVGDKVGEWGAAGCVGSGGMAEKEAAEKKRESTHRNHLSNKAFGIVQENQ